MKKNILVIAKNNKVEALRVAVGLTLLSDPVKVDVLDELDDSPQAREQLEVLEFADVPYEILEDRSSMIDKLAQDLVGSNVVYVI
ncbi:MAG: hypothetical protein ACYCY5_04770 [Sulfuricella sp.]